MIGNDRYRIPCCKPLRLIELVILVVCLNILFFSRQYDPRRVTSFTSGTVIYAYSAFGSIFAITVTDVVCQLFREPVPNTPMIIFSLSASVMCLAAGILLFLQYMSMTDNKETYRFLFVLVFLASASFSGAAIFAIDAILVLKCSIINL